MSFAALSGLWLGLIALPVIVLYILKIKRHSRVVPYLKMWADLVADKQFTTLFQRLQRFFSLLLQLLIASCLVCALAALTLSDSYLQEDSVVLIIDTSASMAGFETEAAERTRFEAAIAKARELVEGRSPEDQFAVIAAGSQPEVLQGFTRSTLRLREAVDKVRLTKASGDLESAVRLAEDLLQGMEHPHVMILSDAAGGESEALSVRENVRWIRIGESVGNVAIRRFQVRKNHAMGTDYLLLVVSNESDTVQDVEVEIYLEGNLKKLVPLSLAPNEVHNESLTLTLPEGGFAKAVIVHPKIEVAPGEGIEGEVAPERHDGLALDDVAYAVVPPARLYRVLLVARNEAEQEPFKAALGALGTLVDREESEAATPGAYARFTDEQVASFDLVLFVNWAPKRLPAAGRFFAVNVLPGGLPGTVRGVEKSPRIRDMSEDHALTRFLEPKSLLPLEARPLDLTGGEVFMSTVGGPVGVVFRTPERKVVYIGLDVLSDLFFLQVAFPVILRNALGWMHEEESELLDATYRPGSVVRPRFSVAGAEVEMNWRHEWVAREAASGKAKLAVRDGRFYFGETGEPGRYWVTTAEGEAWRTAVNLFDARESSLAMPEPPTEPEISSLERSGFLFGRDLWPLLLLVAAFLSVLEWGMFHRRFTE